MYRSPRKKERKAEKEKKSSRSVELSLFVLFVFSAQKAVVVRTLTEVSLIKIIFEGDSVSIPFTDMLIK